MSTTAITREDVISVADSINQSLSDTQIQSVLDVYESEQDASPTDTWNLVVENCIYNILNK